MTTTKYFGRWIGWMCLLLAFTAMACRVSGQRLLSFGGGADRQQPTASVADPGLPVVTPELEADMLAAHQHFTEAIAAYRKIRPQTAVLYNKIGICYHRLAMLNEARYNYGQAIKMDRRFAPAYNNLGTLEYHGKDNKNAERMYRKAIRLDGKMPSFWSNLGAAYLAEKKYRDGAEAYQHAFVLDQGIFQEVALNGIHENAPEEDLAKMNLCFAEIYAQAGMKTQAVEYLRKALTAGFRDRQGLQNDQQLASLRGMPEFEQLLATQRMR